VKGRPAEIEETDDGEEPCRLWFEKKSQNEESAAQAAETEHGDSKRVQMRRSGSSEINDRKNAQRKRGESEIEQLRVTKRVAQASHRPGTGRHYEKS